MSRARDLIGKFGREEDAFLRTEFVAPVLPGAKVRIRIGGIVCELAVEAKEPAIAVLRPRSHREAEVVRRATAAEARRYLSVFPRARLVVAATYGDTVWGLAAAAAPRGLKIEGLVPILFGSASLFQTAVVRFDGSLFLLESTERAPVAAFLRGELGKSTPPERLRRPGLTAAERKAYELQAEIRNQLAKSAEERRLEHALKFAGADLVRYEERSGVFTVTFRVDGREYTSLVARDNLTVVSAGICLDGRDGDFDLTSLVSVLREHHESE